MLSCTYIRCSRCCRKIFPHSKNQKSRIVTPYTLCAFFTTPYTFCNVPLPHILFAPFLITFVTPYTLCAFPPFFFPAMLTILSCYIPHLSFPQSFPYFHARSPIFFCDSFSCLFPAHQSKFFSSRTFSSSSFLFPSYFLLLFFVRKFFLRATRKTILLPISLTHFHLADNFSSNSFSLFLVLFYASYVLNCLFFLIFCALEKFSLLFPKSNEFSEFNRSV